MSPSDPRVRITRLAHVVYRHPDLPKAAEFLEHFGLDEVERTDTRIYYKGYGPDPYCYVAEKSPSGKREFGGGAWIAESFAELEKATKLPGASPIEKAQGPGGGSIVTVPDPGGHVIKLLYGQEILEPSLHPPKAEMNTAQEKNRVGVFHRMKAGPAKVHKAGHYGYVVPADEFLMLRSWYSTNFNFMLTDTTYNKKTGQDETSFLHVDLGETFVDHHGIFFSSGFPTDKIHIHHSSFEVHDMDTQLFGHQWLEQHGYTNCWGVGRHLLGSQLFDYWFDPSGNIVEHYADGDLVNSKTMVAREPAEPESLYVWGPNISLAFLSGQMKDALKQVPSAETGALEQVAAN